MVIAAFIGGGVGYGVSFLFGDPVYWILLCATIAIATDSALRMMHRGHRSSSVPMAEPGNDNEILKAEKPEKPPNPHF